MIKLLVETKSLHNVPNYKPSRASELARIINEDFNIPVTNFKKLRKNDFYIYIIELNGSVEDWCHKKLFEHIPNKVYELIEKKKCILVFNNEAEGDDLNPTPTVDMYHIMHNLLSQYKIPQSQFYFINGDLHFDKNYTSWCLEKNVKKKINHFCIHRWFNNDISEPVAVLSAIQQEKGKSKDFLSLNRGGRPHRIDHLYFLISRNLLSKGFVSGFVTPEASVEGPTYIENAKKKDYLKKINITLPLLLDGNWANLHPSLNFEDHIYPINFYCNSFLNFVTETHFDSPNCFLTEKSFRPLLLGHPFIILGSKNMLLQLDNLGFKVDFDFIDPSYDNVKNPIKRFTLANNELYKWCSLTYEEKIKNIERNIDKIEFNQQLMLKKNLRFNGYERFVKILRESIKVE